MQTADDVTQAFSRWETAWQRAKRVEKALEARLSVAQPVARLALLSQALAAKADALLATAIRVQRAHGRKKLNHS